MIWFMVSAAMALEVRSDRPRILISDGSRPGVTIDEYRQRCNDAAYDCRTGDGGGEYPAMSLASGYLETDESSYCDKAVTNARSLASEEPGSGGTHTFISNNTNEMLQLAAVLDWCDPVLYSDDRAWLEDTILERAQWYATATNEGVYHDDWTNIWKSVALAGLVLAHTRYDREAQELLDQADTAFKDVGFPALAHLGDFWHEGFGYAGPAVGSLAWYAAAWTIATDEDIFAWAESNAGDVFNGYIAWYAYLLRPDLTFAYFGDASDTRQDPQLHTRWLVDLLTLGTDSELGRGLSLEIDDAVAPGWDYSGADSFLLPLLFDASASKVERTSLPRSRWLSRRAADVAVLRSGWTADDSFVAVSCGDYFGPHQHIEAGSFHFFDDAILTGPTGYYDGFETDHWLDYYGQHSVHANTIAVFRPGEVFPNLSTIDDPDANVNDGGQRPLRRDLDGTIYAATDLDTYLKYKTSGPHYETGDIAAFETTDCFDYVACDITSAYNSTRVTTNGNVAKVEEVTRQFLFVPPETLVVFDRVTATDPSYQKRVLFHSYDTAQVSASSGTFELEHQGLTLTGTVLLPDGAQLTVIEDFEVDGVSRPPGIDGSEQGGTRVEVSPSREQTTDVFLTVLSTAAGGVPSAVVTSNGSAWSLEIEDSEGSTATIDLGPDLGAVIAASHASGAVCQLAAEPADDDTGSTDTSTGKPACGCSAGAGPWTATLWLLAVALVRRERTRS